jgi:hypothetical protein
MVATAVTFGNRTATGCTRLVKPVNICLVTSPWSEYIVYSDPFLIRLKQEIKWWHGQKNFRGFWLNGCAVTFLRGSLPRGCKFNSWPCKYFFCSCFTAYHQTSNQIGWLSYSLPLLLPQVNITASQSSSKPLDLECSSHNLFTFDPL